jgi:uncharacterized membrane protein
MLDKNYNVAEKIICRYDGLCSLQINSYPVYAFFWNILLLIIPFFIAKMMNASLLHRRGISGKISGLVFFLLWILFIPNSVYVITDMRHISGFCPYNAADMICAQNAWMIAVFFIYSLSGWVAFIYLMNQMKAIMEKFFNKYLAFIFIIASLPIIALGTLLGLIDRLNSWDVFFSFNQVLAAAVRYLTEKELSVNFLVYTASLYFLYFFGNFVFKKIF